MLPENLIADFWVDVLVALSARHGLTPDDAAAAVGAYRAVLAEKQIGDLTYHREPDQVAETVADGWKSGFFRPTALTRLRG